MCMPGTSPCCFSFRNKLCLRKLGARRRPWRLQSKHFTNSDFPVSRLLSPSWRALIWTQSLSSLPLQLLHVLFSGWWWVLFFVFKSLPWIFFSMIFLFLMTAQCSVVKVLCPNHWIARESPDFILLFFFLPPLTDLHSSCISPLSHSRPPSQTPTAFSNVSWHVQLRLPAFPQLPATVTGQGKPVVYLLDLLFYDKY